MKVAIEMVRHAADTDEIEGHLMEVCEMLRWARTMLIEESVLSAARRRQLVAVLESAVNDLGC